MPDRADIREPIENWAVWRDSDVFIRVSREGFERGPQWLSGA